MLDHSVDRGMTMPGGTRAVGGPGRLGRLAVAGFLLYILAVFVLQATVVLGGDYFHEEFRSLFRYHQVGDPVLFAGDYLADYAAAFPQPLLYEAATRLWMQLVGDLLLLHRAMILGCWLLFAAGIVLAARRLAGGIAAVAVLGLAVAQPMYLYQMGSALPHAFAFPLLAWGLVAGFYGSALGLAGVVILSGLLYPVFSPLLGLCLVWLVFVRQRAFSRPRAEMVKSVLLVGVTGLVALWLLYGILATPEQFGRALQPFQEAETFPENGADGRHFGGIVHPVKFVIGKIGLQFHDFFGPYWLLVLLAYALVAFYGLFVLPRREAAARFFMVFIGIAVLLGAAAFLLRPFHAYRFLLYPLLMVLPLLFVVGVQQLFRRFRAAAGVGAAAALIAAALVALASDSLNAHKLGFWWRLDADTRRVMDFAAEQPPQTVFAVWPDIEGPLELLPYIARRPLLVMEKLHYPSFERHALEMRARANALVDAYLATDEAPLRDLHCRWGVAYLVAEKAHFAAEGTPPDYIPPFKARIEAIRQGRRPEEFLLQAPPARLVALETEAHFVLDLAATAPACGGDAPAAQQAPAGIPPEAAG
ncbi:hypothetical protein [Pelagibius sp. 7325]|uniref:hypothetical protein n=1 Tax=Pelagibius sp. 7325 TaxID=3131994 RepID=UPI0030EF9B2D